MRNPITRRQLLKTTAAMAGVAIVGAELRFKHRIPPVRTITSGPKHHWFGYYDKQEFDPTNRFVLSNQVGFEHRTPRSDDSIEVGMIDTQGRRDAWIELGTSRAWGWQQGCMLQWRPGSNNEVVWNDRQDDRYVCRVMNVVSREKRTLSLPIYALSPDGKWAITADFARIQRMRPGYGYVGLADPDRHERAPESSGVWKINMETGESQLIFSLADAAGIDHQGESLANHWNYFNHLLISPNSQRFIVLHRWRKNEGTGDRARPVGGFSTRMFTVNLDGSEKYMLDPSGYTSHFIWRDADHVCAWTKPSGRKSAFYLFKDQTKAVEIVGDGIMTRNGHNTYVPKTDNEWILCDTYPDRQTRNQSPYLFHVPSNRRIELGQFHSPSQYAGEWRCDTHPRCNNDGTMVAIDSPHTGAGRQIHLIEIGDLIR